MIMRVNPKALVIVAFIALIAVVVSAMPFQKRRARTVLPNGGAATIAVPSFFGSLRGARSSLMYESSGRPARTAQMLHTFFEQPVMVLPGPNPTTALCVYNFDVGFRVIAFDATATERENNDELKVIVPKSDIAARHATADEIAFTAERLEQMPQATFEELSIPTLDLGFVKMYAKQENVIARVREALSREHNKTAAR